MALPISVLNAYWLAITQIEAEQALLQVQIVSYPKIKKEGQDRFIRMLRNNTKFLEDNRPETEMTLEQLAVKLARGV